MLFTGGKTIEKKIKWLSQKSLQGLLFQDSDEAPIVKSIGLCGRRWGWDVSREQHRNMYII